MIGRWKYQGGEKGEEDEEEEGEDEEAEEEEQQLLRWENRDPRRSKDKNNKAFGIQQKDQPVFDCFCCLFW